MSAEERDNKIINAFKEKDILRFTEIKKKTSLTDPSLDRGLDSLEHEGKIVKVKKRYALKENENKLEKYKTSPEETFKSLKSYQLHRDHSEDLKKVIRHWIEDFPTVTVYGMDINKPNEPLRRPIYTLPFQYELKLQSENELLFNDLLFHMKKQEQEIVDLWEEFKEICLVFHIKIEALVSEIEKDVVELINNKIAKRTSNVKLIIVYRWEVNSISVNFLLRIYEACIIWAKGDAKEFFTYLKDFEPSTICIQSLLQDSLQYNMNEYGYAWIEQGLLEAEEFKNEMDDVWNKMIEKSKTDYYPKGKEIVDLKVRLIEMEDQILSLLRKQLSYPVFKGKCEYLEG